MPRYRLAYLVTHPIQYQAPLLRTIAAEPELDLRVFFCSDFSVGRFEEAEFGREIEWDVPLLEGYKHAFLPALGARTRITFWRPFNYGLSRRLAEDPGVATPHILFAGDGPLRPEFERRAAEVGLGSVRFLGFRGQLELPALYDLCDVFVLPSVFEPWGLVVNEAMNAGRAVVVSDRVGCGPDLVEPGVNGHLFKAGDVGALRDALARLVADPEACRAMGRRSLEIINRWSFREDVEGLKAALAFVLREPQRGPPA